MTRSILSYVEIFTDPRLLPRIEMELILRGSEICFSPSISEVSEMILSVVAEVSIYVKYWIPFPFTYKIQWEWWFVTLNPIFS